MPLTLNHDDQLAHKDENNTLTGVNTFTQRVEYTGASSQGFHVQPTSQDAWITVQNPTVGSSGRMWIGQDAAGNSEIWSTGSIKALEMTTQGYVKQEYQPAFRVGKTSGQQGSGGSYIDPVSFQTSYFNIGNHFNLSTDKFTAPVAGRYMFGWMLGMYRYSATWMGIYSYVNNSFLAHTQTFNYSAPSWINFDGSVLVQLQANDTFHIVGRHDSNAGIDNSGCFWGYLVG
jgi:hypothetical protein